MSQSISQPPLYVGLGQGAMAGCGAAIFSNPFEVIKIRLQLQGEMQKKSAATTVYTGTFSGLAKIFQNEGIRGVQKGLGSAFCYQIILNGTRLGLYEPIKQTSRGLLQSTGLFSSPSSALESQSKTTSALQVACSLAAGYVLGFISAILANPFFLVKTRMQSASPIAQVGKQHTYTGIAHAVTSIYHNEGGIRGLFHGSYFAALRTGAGSSVQLASYDAWKRTLTRKVADGGVIGLDPGSFQTHLLSSFLSSFVVMLCMNPFDVVMTRVYNNSGGAGARGEGGGGGGSKQYASFRKELFAIASTEGFGGLYKGAFAMWARVAPHTVMTFVLLEQIKKFSKNAGY